jgi:hypothetical protein
MTIGENYYYGGLLRFDMSPKPAYLKLKELLQKRWHTEKEILTNARGQASFRGFFGEYDVLIETEKGTVTKALKLSKKGENDFVLIV